MNEIKNKIHQILLSIRPDLVFDENVNYIDDGYFDSFDIVTIVSELEMMFGIKISGLDVLPENFNNTEKIIRLVERTMK
ncbi:acyl carrier protein [Polynucleobacter sp. AP-Sving-400A-A2]|uniref:acyl carrier protein n=1 Tax=Polynucleobacter sp. AP-Sving-400A-A2 TaxID=2081049 RepID=UPI001BFE105B|nr:acyl carrier protein [Polynucleobacter sp. AP-Sving-400A-A2]